MKERLDVLVVSRGLAPSREKRKRLLWQEMCWLTDREKIRRAPCLKTLWKSP